jgi:integrase
VAKRRSRGEGTIYFSNTHQRWVAQISLPGGKRKTKYGKTQGEVKEWLLEKRKALQDGTYVEPGKIPCGDFLARYMKDVAEHSLRPTTLQSYFSLIRNHIEPGLGGYKLTQITPAQIQNFYSEKLNAGLSKRTVQFMHSIIHRALQQALKWGLVVRNAADLVDAPSPRRKPPMTWTIEQIKHFLRVVEDHPYYPIYVLAVFTGMREGELLALHWSDISLNAGKIQVKRTLQVVRGKGLVISEPKTEKSKRSIVIPDNALRVLEGMKEEEGLVFKTRTGKPISPRNLVRHFKSAIETAGLPEIRFHDLRHTFATIHLQADTNPKVVQEMLGHSQISLTLDTYSHVLPSVQEDAAKKFNDLFTA